MPDILILVVAVCLLAGIAVGFLAGLLGIGGGLVTVPVLTWLMIDGLSIGLEDAMPIAIATSLLTIVFTGFSSANTHYKLGNIRFTLLMYSGLGVILGAAFGAQLVVSLPGEVLAHVFAALVLLVAMNMLFGRVVERQQQPNKLILIAIGISTGVLSSLMGIGGGALLVPALSWFGVPLRHAIGSAAACGMLIALSGTASFALAGIGKESINEWVLGYILWPAAISVSVTSVFMAPVGARWGQTLDTRKLKRIFAVFLILVSIRMMWGL